jgi:hypothetical protein
MAASLWSDVSTAAQHVLIYLTAINQSINQSNVFIKPFLHQPLSQSAVQKPSLKPQTASNADVETHASIEGRNQRVRS